ncbi:MAG: hypothetical protein KOO69_03145 [Victivallales bacterium]|nr:hypothetical protein [Victivallales bacterium]
MNKNELVAIDKMDIVSLFTKRDDMDKILLKIREAVFKDLVQNVDTAANRKALASAAYRVSQSKTLIDEARKSLVSKQKQELKEIDKSGKRARDYLDDLRDEVREPLTCWELAEKEKEEKEKAAIIFAKAWDDAHAEHELFLRQEAIEKKEAELSRRQAEEEAEIVRIQAEKDAIEAQKKHDEQIRQDAIKQAENEAIKMKELEAEEKRKLIIQAEKENLQALADLKAKIENEEKEKIAKLEREEAIAKEKASNIAHQTKINNIVLKGLMDIGIMEDQAKQIIINIITKVIKHVTINY